MEDIWSQKKKKLESDIMSQQSYVRYKLKSDDLFQQKRNKEKQRLS